MECPLAGADLERDPTIEIKGAPRLLALCTFKNGTDEVRQENVRKIKMHFDSKLVLCFYLHCFFGCCYFIKSYNLLSFILLEYPNDQNPITALQTSTITVL